MKYISYLFFIAVIGTASFFIYNKYWKNNLPDIHLPTLPARPVVPGVKPGPKVLSIGMLRERFQTENNLPDLRKIIAEYRKTGNLEEVRAWQKVLIKMYPETADAAGTFVTLGDSANVNDDLWNARQHYTTAYAKLTGSAQDNVYRKIIDINNKLVWSTRAYPGAKDTLMYVIQPGDSLDKIASKFNCPYRFIKKINRMTTNNIRVGKKLKVIKGLSDNNMKMKLVVEKSRFRLTVYLNGYLLSRYAVGIGANDLTPETTFKVKDRIKDPIWETPKGKFPAGHPKNILGKFYLKFEHDQFEGFGLHGSTARGLDPRKPETIQKANSAGCIRMFDQDIKEIFTIVPRGTLVTIVK